MLSSSSLKSYSTGSTVWQFELPETIKQKPYQTIKKKKHYKYAFFD